MGVGGLWCVYTGWAAVLQHFMVAPPWSGGRCRHTCTQLGIQIAALAAAGRWIIAVAAAVVVAVLVKLDRMGPLAGLNFQPQAHPIAALQQVAAYWPKDGSGSGSLSRAEVTFASQRGYPDVMGPESLEFDSSGVGPYTGVADGRVIRWKNGSGWETFAVVSPTWERSCTTLLNPKTEKARWKEEAKCGRPLGLKFDDSTGTLYIADAYLGIYSVGAEGGQARAVSLATADRQALMFANDLDLHPNGSIFFTDSSRRWRRQHYMMAMLEGEGSGRLLRHDPGSGQTHVVLSGLHFPNGVAISGDGSYLLLTETTNARVLRVWLGSSDSDDDADPVAEVVAELPGYPDNIRRVQGQRGRFWVAINGPRTAFQEMCSRSAWLKKLIFKLPLPLPVCLWLFFRPWPRPYPTAALLEVEERESRARVVRVLEERSGKVIKSLSEVQERDGRLWMGSVAHNQIATLHL